MASEVRYSRFLVLVDMALRKPPDDRRTVTAFRLDNHLPADFLTESLRADVLRGLTSTPKMLPPKWFYDDRGSQLFDQITRLPEYYPTRAEREILLSRSASIASRTGAHTLVELGAGTAEKTRILLTELANVGTLQRFIPVDVSVSVLVESCETLMLDYPSLDVHAVMADFETQLGLLPPGGPRLTAFLGGTIGNFAPAARLEFVKNLRQSMDAGDWLLLGTDLVKSPDVLVPAYNDASGVTAEFNRNVLHVINRELKSDFDPAGFDHLAVWDDRNEWMCMQLRASQDHEVRIAGLDLTVNFSSGEVMQTEISAKFRQAGVEEELANAGFAVQEWWTDSEGRYALSLSSAID